MDDYTPATRSRAAGRTTNNTKMAKPSKDLSEYDLTEGASKTPADYINKGNYRKVGSRPDSWKVAMPDCDKDEEEDY